MTQTDATSPSRLRNSSRISIQDKSILTTTGHNYLQGNITLEIISGLAILDEPSSGFYPHGEMWLTLQSWGLVEWGAQVCSEVRFMDHHSRSGGSQYSEYSL